MRAAPTVRARITALATLLVLVVLIVAGIGLVTQQRRLLTATLDETLEQRAGEIAELAGDLPTELASPGEDDAIAQVIRAGVVVASTDNITGLEPVVDPTSSADGSGRIRTVERLPHEDSAFRVLTLQSGEDVVIVAGTLDDIEESIATLIRSLVVAVPLVVAALALVLWWLVGRTLRPVEAIRTEVAEIGGRELYRRVPVPPGDDEVARLARTMNEMLDRVEEAAHRQQRFVADASHELRSPLTRIRTELEVDLAHPDQADLLATHASVLEEAVGLQHLADDLLHLARVDSGHVAEPVVERVDLDDVLLRAARRLRAMERVSVDLSGVRPAAVEGDRQQLSRLVGNLADNAIRHARRTVAFTLADAGDRIILTVADDGPGVAAPDHERIFERFTRADAARGAADGGTGLGLAIARDIAERHGGTLRLDPTAATGARFELVLPA